MEHRHLGKLLFVLPWLSDPGLSYDVPCFSNFFSFWDNQLK